MSQNDDYDPWAGEALAGNPAGDDLNLIIETTEGVEPLDDQFGVHPPKTVPDALYEVIFGQPEPTEAEIAAAGGTPENVPPMQTYAILDAAKVVNLVATLATTGLEHRCLFKGDAYDELKDVAPWIVRLEEGDKFTRHLFTSGKAPWYLWDKEPGIYVRSRATLDDMWRHFRKFTKIQDENGKWFYFRFWEPFSLFALANYSHPQKDHLLQEALYVPGSSSVLLGAFYGDTFIQISKLHDSNIKSIRRVPCVSEHEKKIFEAVATFRFDQRLRTYLTKKDDKFSALPFDKQQRILNDITDSAARFGIFTEKAVADFAEANILYRRPLERNSDFLNELQSGYHDLDRSANLLKMVKSMVTKDEQ